MIETRVHLAVVSPMFMRGNEGVELRPQSFKGVMRWWWRAIKSCSDLKKLHREEANIFGYSDMGASRVWIDVKGGKVANSTVNLSVSGSVRNYTWRIGKEPITWSSEKMVLKGSYPGLAYLMYPFLMRGLSRNNRSKTLNHIAPGDAFTLTLRSFYHRPLRQALASLWCAVWLGGFGARSRRGGGNLAFISEPSDDISLDLNFTFKEETFYEWFRSNLQRCANIIGVAGDHPPYSHISSAKVIVGKDSYSSWHEALNAIGKIFYDLRRNGDHEKNFVFGLPHKYNQCHKYKRRASPIILKVLKLNDRDYRWMVLYFKGPFLPLRECKAKIDFSPIYNFLKAVAEQGGVEIDLFKEAKHGKSQV